MSKKTTIILIVIAAIVFIAVGVFVGMDVAGNKMSAGAALSPYSAVYLSTGDIYFGKLDWFPTPHIEDAWFLEHGTDAKGNPATGVYPFSQIEWGPAGDVYLNSKQIVFWTALSSTSSIVQAIENPPTVAAVQQNGGAGTEVPQPTASSSSNL